MGEDKERAITPYASLGAILVSTLASSRKKMVKSQGALRQKQILQHSKTLHLKSDNLLRHNPHQRRPQLII